METKNNVLITGLLSLILGLIIGYVTGTSSYRSSETTKGDYPQDKGTDDYTSMHGEMNGMTLGLSGKMGDEMDKAFLNEMIVHHEGAVEMAQALLKETKRPELLKLGNDITTAQTQEIQMMKEWRKAWFNQ
ncbi:MAG: hypothetical protein A2481_02565 [Candidatus Yonathbacteria bacterium RIFOXYC2_FULL_47_9]|nr:MAG: hypothetical protein A2481_02565 [Candidatus Yonathbacteria bacterium RIFOXYC2_FULL_47_9]HAT68582.1 hypothetical protein [Candidatus Yonathbacteria bacterium]